MSLEIIIYLKNKCHKININGRERNLYCLMFVYIFSTREKMSDKEKRKVNASDRSAL